jgi:hypothetical protein
MSWTRLVSPNTSGGILGESFVLTTWAANLDLTTPLFGRWCSLGRVLTYSGSILGVVFIQATALQLLCTSYLLFSSPPSPGKLLACSPNMVSSPRNPFLDDAASDSTAAEPLLFPSAKNMPATHDLFDVLAKSLNNDDDGLMPPPPPRYPESSCSGSSITPATPMTVPPSPSSPSKRPRKRARMDHGDR